MTRPFGEGHHGGWLDADCIVDFFAKVVRCGSISGHQLMNRLTSTWLDCATRHVLAHLPFNESFVFSNLASQHVTRRLHRIEIVYSFRSEWVECLHYGEACSKKFHRRHVHTRLHLLNPQTLFICSRMQMRQVFVKALPIRKAEQRTGVRDGTDQIIAVREKPSYY